jgi:hypothetical protein
MLFGVDLPGILAAIREMSTGISLMPEIFREWRRETLLSGDSLPTMQELL